MNEEPQKFKCNTCQKCFKTRSTLKSHLKNVHIKQERYDCHLCEKSYTSGKTTLTRHIKAVHSKTKKHECSICKKTFSYEENFRRHIRTVHENIKQFECDICKKCFALSLTLNRHKVHSVWKRQKSLEEVSITKVDTIWTFGSISIKIEDIKKIDGRNED